ncbi:MAG: hypothetical protein LBN39_05720 [Planctomycetaceae bacterium]|nr:hypothetical protein [Planctomycetaceae bacterium]
MGPPMAPPKKMNFAGGDTKKVSVMVFNVPEGLQDAVLMPYHDRPNGGSYLPMKYKNQIGKVVASDEKNNWFIPLGNLNAGSGAVVVQRLVEPYQPALLKVKCYAPDGKVLPYHFISVKYPGLNFTDPVIKTEDGQVIHVGIERSPDALPVFEKSADGSTLQVSAKPVLAEPSADFNGIGNDRQNTV